MTEAFERYQKRGLQAATPDIEDPENFIQELSWLLSKYGKETSSGTPDTILADYLLGCLEVFNATVRNRAAWCKEPIDKIFNLTYDNEIPIVLENRERGPGEKIGMAKPEMLPGMSARHGKIVRLKPVFAPPLSADQQAMEIDHG